MLKTIKLEGENEQYVKKLLKIVPINKKLDEYQAPEIKCFYRIKIWLRDRGLPTIDIFTINDNDIYMNPQSDWFEVTKNTYKDKYDIIMDESTDNESMRSLDF